MKKLILLALVAFMAGPCVASAQAYYPPDTPMPAPTPINPVPTPTQQPTPTPSGCGLVQRDDQGATHYGNIRPC